MTKSLKLGSSKHRFEFDDGEGDMRFAGLDVLDSLGIINHLSMEDTKRLRDFLLECLPLKEPT